MEHWPYEPELAQYLGEIAMECKEWDSAFDWFERAGEMNRNDRHVWIPLMRHFYGQNDAVRAAACLDHLEELAQYLPGLWVEFDEVYTKAGRREELLERLERWLELGMVGSAHWVQLADLYERAGQADRAAACRAKATAPPPGPAPKDEARAYLETRGDAPELPVESEQGGGEAAPTLPTEPEPTEAEYWIGQGEAHFQQGRLDEALASLNRALSLDVPRFRAWFRIGALFYLIGHLEEAENAFHKATILNGDEAKGWYNLGVCQAEQGRLAPARESFQNALAHDRRFGKAWDWLGLLHFNAGEHALARRCFVRCLAVSRNAANAWHNLGMLYRAMGNSAESMRCLEQVRRLGGVQEQHTIASLGAGGVGGDQGLRPTSRN